MEPKHPNQIVRFHATRKHILRETQRIQAGWSDQERVMRSIGTRAVLVDGLPQPVEIKEFSVIELFDLRKPLNY